jgi:hypothetical protein
MIATPWKWFTRLGPDAEVVALLTYLPLARWAAVPRFMRHSFDVQEQLKTSRGLVGYSLQAQLMARKFWTLSAWTDAATRGRGQRAHGRASDVARAFGVDSLRTKS